MLLVGAVRGRDPAASKSPLQLAAFTAVLLAGFEMVQTYWLYTYIPWFFPFAAIALLVPATGLRTLVARSGIDEGGFDATRFAEPDEESEHTLGTELTPKSLDESGSPLGGVGHPEE